MKKLSSVLLICLVSLSFTFVFGKKAYRFLKPGEMTYNDKGKLEKILSEKELRVVLDVNSIDYFIYKGEPRGFQYDLLKEFCADNNLKLTITASTNLSNDIEKLKNNELDIIARNIVVDNIASSGVDHTLPLVSSKIVLVQRKATGSSSKMKIPMISARSGLMGKVVYLPKNSSIVKNIETLNKDLGNTISVVKDQNFDSAQLISMVASGKINYTVCDEAVGEFLKEHYSNLDFSVPVAFDQNYSWMVKSESPEWKRFLDIWIENFKQSDRYDEIVEDYYTNESVELFEEGEFNSFIGGRLSEYDETIKEVSRVFEFDWRLITSIILKESKFNPEVESHKGASGLMQLMPKTAKLFNVFDTKIPSENIRGGVAYLSWLEEIFNPIIPNENQRLKFVLAAYNAGIGHVMDARRLAMKYNYDPSVWDGNVSYFLLKKSEPEFYNDPVVEHGYCRGIESSAFVDKVLDRYSHYLNIIPSDDNRTLAALKTQK